jgi:hypothetical protein
VSDKNSLLITLYLDGKIQYEGSYAELNQNGALKQLIKECCEDKPQISNEDEREEFFSDEDYDEIFEPDDQSVDNMLGTSVLSTVSGIHRRSTTIKPHRRRKQSVESAASSAITTRQLTGVEKVEVGRVSYF